MAEQTWEAHHGLQAELMQKMSSVDLRFWDPVIEAEFLDLRFSALIRTMIAGGVICIVILCMGFVLRGEWVYIFVSTTGGPFHSYKPKLIAIGALTSCLLVTFATACLGLWLEWRRRREAAAAQGWSPAGKAAVRMGRRRKPGFLQRPELFEMTVAALTHITVVQFVINDFRASRLFGAEPAEAVVPHSRCRRHSSRARS